MGQKAEMTAKERDWGGKMFALQAPDLSLKPRVYVHSLIPLFVCSRVSLCSQDWSGTDYADTACPVLIEIHLSTS